MVFSPEVAAEASDDGTCCHGADLLVLTGLKVLVVKFDYKKKGSHMTPFAG
jgi:hypothetical protein